VGWTKGLELAKVTRAEGTLRLCNLVAQGSRDAEGAVQTVGLFLANIGSGEYMTGTGNIYCGVTLTFAKFIDASGSLFCVGAEVSAQARGIGEA
jgi:hypothetical protein